MPAQEILIIAFLFVLGACVGSFLNVVVFRLSPQIAADGAEIGDAAIANTNVPDYSLRAVIRDIFLDLRALMYPPSTCPNCNTRLAARDNIPVLGWILLSGKCRYCKTPISARYPIVEAAVGVTFAVLYALLFHFGMGPCTPGISEVNRFGQAVIVPGGLQIARDWPLLALYLMMTAGLIAASLVDAKTFMIPLSIPWFIGLVGVVSHGFISVPGAEISRVDIAGSLAPVPLVAIMTVAFLIGWIISLTLLQWGIIPRSFAAGEPSMNIESPTHTRGQITAEMLKEAVFLALPMVLAAIAGVLWMRLPAVGDLASTLSSTPILAGMIGATFGGIVGALLIWVTRILGSIVFGKEAMGLGDVHLMFAVGAVIGAYGSVITFFLAPAAGLLLAIYLFLTTKNRHLPYGPYLSAAAVVTVVLYCPIFRWMEPGVEGLRLMLAGG